jgi:WD40 repeat protein
VTSVAISPDGHTLASGSQDNTVIFWDLASGQPLDPQLTFDNYPGLEQDPNFRLRPFRLRILAFSPDGQLLAVAGVGNSITLWDVATGQPVGPPLLDHFYEVNSLAFSPNGQILASGSADRTVMLWDVTTGQALGLPLTGHTSKVNSVAFSPDGKILASSSANPYATARRSADKSIILWDVDVESWQARACRRANRNLTRVEWRQFFGDRPYRPTCPDLPVPASEG